MIDIQKLSFSFNRENILNNINCSIPEKGITAIMGHNGSGKTTLIKIIAGIYRNYSGSILLDNEEIKNISSKMLSKKIAFVPGEIYCPFDFSVEDIIIMGLNPYKKWWGGFNSDDKKKVSILMEEMQISYLKGKYINKISSGEKQLVFLAQALIQKPKFLLLDEPTSHLDINFKIRIMELLSCVKKEISVILISHDLKAIKYYCDMSLILKSGEKIFFGDVKEINEDYIAYAYNIRDKSHLIKFI